ncbi:Uncharacterized conserved protein [Mycobacterium tuberculosis]|nr:Uncharacterized conserved protein [Mycobacterium tuberculosis]
MIKEMYRTHRPVEIEELLGAQFVDLFVDIDLDKDVGMSIFVFDQDIQKKFSSS